MADDSAWNESEGGMEIALARMDDRCRLVIPKRIRRKLGIGAGGHFFLYAVGTLLIVKKAETGKDGMAGDMEDLVKDFEGRRSE